MSNIAVVGIGSTEIVRSSAESIGRVAARAALAAIDDAGLTPSQIDGYVGSPGAPNAAALRADGLDEVSSTFMVHALGLQHARWVMDVEGMATGMVVAASHALSAGTCNYVVALRAHYNGAGVKYSRSTIETAKGRDQFTLPYGYGPAGTRFALWLRRYMHDYGATRENLFEIVSAARAHAKRNPLAYWRAAPELTRDQYMTARWIHEPMCLFDSDLPVLGAAALIMTSAERAKDLRHPPAYVASFANAARPQRVFDHAGIRPQDVDVAQIYDGYSPLVWSALEKLGFCDTGEACRFATRDRIGPGGPFPVNTFGGALGEGRLHGIGHVREAVLQVMGRAQERQVSNVRWSLAQVGVPERFWTVLFSPEPL